MVTIGAQAAQSFQGLTCQSDIPKVLIGRTLPSGLVRTTEAKYKHLGLKVLGSVGSEEEGDPLTIRSLKICGQEIWFLQHQNIVKDVLVSPSEAGQSESNIVTCSVDGVASDQMAIVFVPWDDLRHPRQVDRAWFIDDKAVKFYEQRRGAVILCSI